MKYFIIICVITLTFGASLPENNYYELRIVDKVDTYWAENIEDENAETIEERYDGILVQIFLNEEKIDDLYVYQHWFANPRLEYPKIDSVFVVPLFEYKASQFGTDSYEMELNDFLQLLP